MSEDAEVIIKISGDTKNFDSKYMELVKKYKNKEVDLGITANDLGKEEQILSRMNREAERLDQNYGEINQKIKDQEATLERIKNIPRDYTTEEGRLQNIQLENEYNRVNNQLERQKKLSYETLQEIIKQGEQIDTQQSKVDKLNAKYEKQKNDLSVISQKIQEAGKTDIGSKIDGANQSINKTIKSVGKWGLAIFGVRSAYMGIRQIMSNVLSQNEGLGKQMTALKNSLYAAFTPVVEKIINLIRTLMSYINYIWQAFFKKDLFKNVANSTEQTSKNLKSGASSAKEIRKQLAGFDEANILTNNQSSSGGGVSGGVASGNDKIDLGLDKIKKPEWLVFIHDFIEKHPQISKFIFGLAGFTLFGGFKLAGGLLSTISSILGGGTGTSATGLLGIYSTLGLLTAAVWLITLDIVGVQAVIDGIEKTQDALNHKNETTDNTINKDEEYIDTAKEVIKTEDATSETRKKAMDSIDRVTKSTADMTKNEELGWFTKTKYNKSLLNEALQMDELYRSTDLTDEEQYKYYKMLREQFAPMLDETTGKLMGTEKETKDLRDSFKKLDTKFATKYTIEMNETGSNKLISAANRVKDSFTSIGDKWKSVVEKMASGLGITVKKNALGGIVNLPGRGVPLNIAGEAGREGIVPMDNESQMQLLGQSIAKYVNINNVVNNYMDARKINSILQASASNERLANNG